MDSVPVVAGCPQIPGDAGIRGVAGASMVSSGNEVNGVREIDGIRSRLEAAGGLTELLDVAWDAFSVMLAVCQECESQPPGLFAASAFAASAAASGRRVLVAAPSLPSGRGSGTGHEAFVWPDLEEIGDDLAGLADLLGERLSAAAGQAVDPGDRRACQDAAVEAVRIRGLLARERR